MISQAARGGHGAADAGRDRPGSRPSRSSRTCPTWRRTRSIRSTGEDEFANAPLAPAFARQRQRHGARRQPERSRPPGARSGATMPAPAARARSTSTATAGSGNPLIPKGAGRRPLTPSSVRNQRPPLALTPLVQTAGERSCRRRSRLPSTTSRKPTGPEDEIRDHVARLEQMFDRLTTCRVRVDQRANNASNTIPPVVRIELSVPGHRDIVVAHEPDRLQRKFQATRPAQRHQRGVPHRRASTWAVQGSAAGTAPPPAGTRPRTGCSGRSSRSRRRRTSASC